MMKACGYCGRENEDIAAFCAECGTAFREQLPHEETSPHLPLAQRLRELNAWSATVILLAYLAAQAVCVILVVGVISLKAQGSYSVTSFKNVRHTATPIISVLIPVAGGIATILVARILVRPVLRDTSAIGAAWVRGPWTNILKGILVGLFVAACFYTMSNFMGVVMQPRPSLEHTSPSSGFSQMLYGVVTILFAPFSEEILFRGVLYGGYRKSFGAFGAAALTTGLFCLLHLPHAFLLLSLAAGSLATLAARLWSGAVGPAIGLHAGYNAWFFALAVYMQHAA